MPCALPVISAPMAGGPTTPDLVVAVTEAGGFGFLAGGYLTAAGLDEVIAATHSRMAAPFGVNLFVPGQDDGDAAAIAAYRGGLTAEARRLGVEPGEPHWNDDEYPAKLDLVVDADVHLVSFTFGTPSLHDVERLQSSGTQVAITVTSAAEAREAARAGADLLVVQGNEAGGHQGTFDPHRVAETPLLALLAEVRESTELPLVAAGGIGTREAARAALGAGAVAVQVGTALLCTDEADTSAVHRTAVLEQIFSDTELTRAYSGRWARGLANRFVVEHRDAPGGYPQLHHLTRPLRAAGTAADDLDVPSLWAGTAWRECVAAPAAEVVRAIAP